MPQDYKNESHNPLYRYKKTPTLTRRRGMWDCDGNKFPPFFHNVDKDSEFQLSFQEMHLISLEGELKFLGKSLNSEPKTHS